MLQLPVDSIRGPFIQALSRGNVVVESPTGSGKSTRLPLWCAEHGPVLVVEPRRLACRALARHLAELQGEEPGAGVGYAVRFDSRWGEQSRIVFATPGIALRWLADGTIEQFSSVMLDEFHERRWDTDLLAALLRHRDRHRLVITSATVEGERLADYLGAARLEAEGRQFPVEVEYAEAPTDLPRTAGLAERVAKGVQRALTITKDGDILVFLPGRGEIAAAEQALSGVGTAEVIPLHAGVANEVQDDVLRISERRRVILATNVAETSLTIPGVTVVVDSGLERRTHHRNGRTVLGLHVISQSSAEQRRGRAGRVRPGHCIRLWGEQARLERFTPPEVAREELVDLMLAAAAAGTPATALQFPDPLPDHAVERALLRLRAMAAIDDNGQLTEHGRILFPLPFDPLFAHLITAMPDESTRAAMVDLASALTVGRSFIKRGGEALVEWAPEGCDATTLIRLLREPYPEGVILDRSALAEARRMADQTRAALHLPERQAEPVPREQLLAAAIAAVPELVYVRREKRRQALGNGSDEVEIARESRLSDSAEAAVVFDSYSVPGRGTSRTLTRATCNAPVTFSFLTKHCVGKLEQGEPVWDGDTIRVTFRRVYAGRTLDVEEREPQGPALRTAISQLILGGRLRPETGAKLKEDIEAWNLYLALGEAKGEAAEPDAWLTARLERLGVERAEDMELIEAEDLRFEGIPEWEREQFERRYPRRVDLANLPMAVHYEPRRKRVTLERLGGKRRQPPMLKELPAWPGWKVRYRDGSRVIPMK